MKTILLFIVILLAAGPAAAQEEDLAAAETFEEKVLGQADMVLEGTDFAEETEAEAPQAAQWVWGTVEAVGPQARTLVIKHIEYETSEEVTKTLNVDEKTVFQGVVGLAELEAGMHVTIDYKDRDGRCVADVIEVETGGTL